MIDFVGNGEILESVMLLCFGISWPVAIIRTIRSKSVQGVSPYFYVYILVGYASGIVYKLIFNFNYVIYAYITNFTVVFVQTILYFHYKRQHQLNENISNSSTVTRHKVNSKRNCHTFRRLKITL